MQKEQFNKLKEMNACNLITAEQLTSRIDRTLLYGYTCDRRTFHVYLKDGEIYAIVYDMPFEEQTPRALSSICVNSNQDYIPDKRVYPAKSDYEFCSLLISRGVDIPFTFFEDEVEGKVYYGYVPE